MKTVSSVYTLLINTIYLTHSTEAAGGTVINKHKVGINEISFFQNGKKKMYSQVKNL